MRGIDKKQEKLFSYVASESRIPEDHPLRVVREITNQVLHSLSKVFDNIYSGYGRPSVAPEKLLRALVLQSLYSIRSERMLMEQIDYNILFRWFVGLEIDDPVWVPTVFCKNRDRLIESGIAEKFFDGVLAYASFHELVSDDHFTVDGTQIEAWAGTNSFKRIGEDGKIEEGSGTHFRGQERKNDTHVSTTDPQARIYRKGPGKEAKLSYVGHILSENRNHFVVESSLTQATGTAEREAAVEMIKSRRRKRNILKKKAGKIKSKRIRKTQKKLKDKRITLGADKGYDTKGFVAQMRELNVTPHVSQNTKNRSSAVDKRTTRHRGYSISQFKRSGIEKIFGWLKTAGLLRKVRFCGVSKIDFAFKLAITAYNLTRMKRLINI